MPMDSTGFPGDEELESVIAELVQRPALTDAERGGGRTVRGDRPLPLICVVGAGRRDVLVPFAERFATTRDLAFARVDAEAVAASTRDAEGPLPPLPLLTAAREKLELDAFGPYHQPTFDRYRLVEWLTTQRVDREPGGNRRRRTTEMLRRWSGRGPRTANDGSGAATVVEDVPTLPARTALWLVLAVAGRLGMRVTGVRRQARWLMRQPYVVPAHSRDIQGFAERLTLPHREREDASQVGKLLVHAFLEDLRAAYRRRHRRVLPRRAGLRRTAYVTLLLDNVTEANGGWELLQLINDVRNETGEHDPLLVVAAGADWPEPRPTADHPPAEAALALRTWRENLPLRRQRFDRYARYLWLRATEPAAPPAPPVAPRRLSPRAVRHRDGSAPAVTAAAEPPPPRQPAAPLTGLRARRPPYPARRGVGEAVLALLLLVVLLPPALDVRESWAAGCSYFRAGFHDGVAVRVAELGRGGRTQCVGYSDSAVQIFGKNDRLRAAQSAVFAQNETAKRLHAQRPDRPFLTVVHFVGLTNEVSRPDTDHASAEELEGLLLRQQEQNQVSDVQPLLRVVVANGGDGMGHAATVAREMLAPLAEADPTVVAVTGMDRTVAQTEQAISELGTAGVPVVGTTLTGTGLAELSPLYFQMVPDNSVQALLVARYAEHLGVERLTVHHPPLGAGDGYVETLLTETRAEAQARGIEVAEESWGRTQGDNSLCTGPDRSGEMVFYVGREADFADFLRTSAGGCPGGRAQLPVIVAGDSVSRFVAQPERRTNSALAGVPVSYVGLGALVTLAGDPCRRGEVPDGTPGGTPLNAFCTGFSRLHPEASDSGGGGAVPWPAERSGVAYDTAGMLIGAVGELHRPPTAGTAARPPHRGAVAQHLRESVFQGATGAVDFRTSRIGNERNLAVLTLEDISDIDAQPACSFLIGTLAPGRTGDPETGCPR
ncbi:ABC transporter substrate-binding protein [Streptomyces bohaiensis]|uniref:ABC transporter substrate-binding protein n=1 Tax=Streptomyces bohaiensis TaxID=1431344 RepID=UPI003B7608F9